MKSNLVLSYKKNRIFLLIISGFLYGFLFPPIISSYAVFALLLPFLFVFQKIEKKRTAFFYGIIYGVSVATSAIPWIFFNQGAELAIRISSGIGTLFVVGLFFGLLGFIYKYSLSVIGSKAVWFFPLLWIGMEHLMTYKEFGFPWITLYNTMTYKLNFIQISDIFGASFISFIIVLINVLIFKILTSSYNKKNIIKISILTISVGMIIFAIILYGEKRIKEIENKIPNLEKIAVGIVHPKLGIKYKWKRKNFKDILKIQKDLTDSLRQFNPDLIVWGETNFPGYLEVYPSYISEFRSWAKTFDINLAIGALGFTKKENNSKLSQKDKYKKYNSVFSFENDGIMQRYDKIYLVPFGEAFPFSWVLTFLKNISLGQANFDRGNKYTLFFVKNKPYSVSICYEGIFSYHNAEFANQGATFFVNISNDAWYKNTSETIQHNKFYVYRAIENRRAVVRLANEAENSYTNLIGEQIQLFGSDKRIGKIVKTTLNEEKTFFTKHHKVIKYTVILSNILYLIFLIILKQTGSENNTRKFKIEK